LFSKGDENSLFLKGLTYEIGRGVLVTDFCFLEELWMARKPIVITMGNPAGIGAEVLLKAFQNPKVMECKPLLVIGSYQLFIQESRNCGISLDLISVIENPSEINDSLPLQLLSIDDKVSKEVKRGMDSSEAGKCSVQYLQTAVHLLKEGFAAGVVTAPISKNSWSLAAHDYPGHTEFFAETSGTQRYLMSFFSDEMRLALVSRHLPLSQVSSYLSEDKIYEVLSLIYENRRLYGCDDQMRIGVCGLNPHAGENGIIGLEEHDKIIPAIQRAKKSGMNVEGPFPADTFFLPSHRFRFDFVVAMYHDQGLIPFKMLAFDRGVNVTLGLPYVRTSVDHGTAYDIVGQGVADSTSMEEAIILARKMISRLSPRNDV
jgi:4-hydroxythreonine-4-phosphate dehydrogenase